MGPPALKASGWLAQGAGTAALLLAGGCAQPPASTLRELLLECESEGSLVGAQYRIVCGGELVEAGCVGSVHLEDPAPVLDDTTFCLASGSKPFVAALVLALATRGELPLDEPVSRWLPGFRGARLADGTPVDAPTLAQLLRHEGGLLGLEKQHDEAVEDVTVVTVPLQERVARLATQPFEFPPGTDFLYSPAGYAVVGRVLEVATGRPLERVLQEQLARPLGAASLTYHPPRGGFAVGGYSMRRGRASDPRMAPLGTEREVSEVVGGGLFATARDVDRLLELVLAEGRVGGSVLIGEEELARMLRDSPHGPAYGLGWMLGNERSGGLPVQAGHSGRLGLSRALFFVDRRSRSHFVVLWTVVHPAEVSARLRVRALEVLERHGAVIEERWK